LFLLIFSYCRLLDIQVNKNGYVQPFKSRVRTEMMKKGADGKAHQKNKKKIKKIKKEERGGGLSFSLPVAFTICIDVEAHAPLDGEVIMGHSYHMGNEEIGYRIVHDDHGTVINRSAQ